MDIIINTDDRPIKNYDNSLFEVFILDYDDNYHRTENDPSNEFEKSVRNLKARYKDINKFNEALTIYYEWFEYLAEKHGSMDLVKKKIKAGVMEDFVPRKPRLKNVKKLKYLYKHGIVTSRVNELIDEYKLEKYLEDNYPEDELNNLKIESRVTNDKVLKEISKEFNDTDIKRYKSKSYMSDAEFLESFFNTKNKTKNKKKKKKSKKNKTLIKDIMSSKYLSEIEESENSPLMSYNGLLLSAGTTKDIDTYHKLDDCGWQSYKLMKRANYNKRMTSMFKPDKKSKKKKKKKNNYEDLIIDIMTDNGYDDFEDFQKEMLSMTSKDLRI